MRKISGDFIQYMLNRTIFPLEEQDHIGTGKDFWCLDWWIIEVCKYFFEGEYDYLRFPIARRLGGNKNFKKEVIVEAALSKVKAMEEMKLLTTDKIIIFETCRGFDTVLATTVRDWSKIFVIITSEYPEVIKRTEEYLERIPTVELVRGIGTEQPIFSMETNDFQGGI